MESEGQPTAKVKEKKAQEKKAAEDKTAQETDTEKKRLAEIKASDDQALAMAMYYRQKYGIPEWQCVQSLSDKAHSDEQGNLREAYKSQPQPQDRLIDEGGLALTASNPIAALLPNGIYINTKYPDLSYTLKDGSVTCNEKITQDNYKAAWSGMMDLITSGAGGETIEIDFADPKLVSEQRLNELLDMAESKGASLVWTEDSNIQKFLNSDRRDFVPSADTLGGKIKQYFTQHIDIKETLGHKKQPGEYERIGRDDAIERLKRVQARQFEVNNHIKYQKDAHGEYILDKNGKKVPEPNKEPGKEGQYITRKIEDRLAYKEAIEDRNLALYKSSMNGNDKDKLPNALENKVLLDNLQDATERLNKVKNKKPEDTNYADEEEQHDEKVAKAQKGLDKIKKEISEKKELKEYVEGIVGKDEGIKPGKEEEDEEEKPVQKEKEGIERVDAMNAEFDKLEKQIKTLDDTVNVLKTGIEDHQTRIDAIKDNVEDAQTSDQLAKENQRIVRLQGRTRPDERIKDIQATFDKESVDLQLKVNLLKMNFENNKQFKTDLRNIDEDIKSLESTIEQATKEKKKPNEEDTKKLEYLKSLKSLSERIDSAADNVSKPKDKFEKLYKDAKKLNQSVVETQGQITKKTTEIQTKQLRT